MYLVLQLYFTIFKNSCRFGEETTKLGTTVDYYIDYSGVFGATWNLHKVAAIFYFKMEALQMFI